MRPGKIYTLTNPVGNEIFYVGSTNVQLNERLNVHVWDARNRPSRSSASKYICRLTLKPIIEELESFDSISIEDLRTAELFWVRQLKAMGFPLVNEARPINDSKSSIRDLTVEEIEYLKSKKQYLSLLRLDNLTISNTALAIILKKGRCTISTYRNIQYAIDRLKKINWSRVVFRTKAVMISLSEDQKNRLAILAKGKSKKASKEIGINYSTISRTLKSGLIRYDKLAHLEQFIGK